MTLILNKCKVARSCCFFGEKQEFIFLINSVVKIVKYNPVLFISCHSWYMFQSSSLVIPQHISPQSFKSHSSLQVCSCRHYGDIFSDSALNVWSKSNDDFTSVTSLCCLYLRTLTASHFNKFYEKLWLFLTCKIIFSNCQPNV